MIFNKNIKISSKYINNTSDIFIIAEAGVNHGGDISKAKLLIDIASNSGADAVKFQTFKTESLILKNVEKASYQKLTTDSNESQYDMLKNLEITKKQNLELQEYCVKKGIIFLTTPFDEDSLEELAELDIPAYKIASTDLTNLPFLEKIAKKNKPIFLSTGMSYLSEVQIALDTIYPLNKDVVLLQCTANYPISDNEANLNILNTFKENFDVIIGYSDHSVGIGAAPYSIPFGVKVIEKHFTLDKTLVGPDHKASLSPEELIEFVKTIKKVENYLGSSIKIPTLAETKTRISLQKCLVAKNTIKKDEPFTSDNIVAKRTNGEGISPIYFKELLCLYANKDFDENEIIRL